MKRYRKKPVVIEAVIWTGENHREMYNFMEDKTDNDSMGSDGKNFTIDFSVVEGGLVTKTLEGRQPASIGDYIVKGVKGEYYPCKPDIFEASHEELTSVPASQGTQHD